jgi:hypothetical protein
VYLWLKVEIFLELQHGNPNKGNKFTSFLAVLQGVSKGDATKKLKRKKSCQRLNGTAARIKRVVLLSVSIKRGETYNNPPAGMGCWCKK